MRARDSLWRGIVMAACAIGAAGLLERAACARWATPDDAEWDTEDLRYEVKVRRDGTATSEIESWLKILREGARSKSTFHLTYNSRASTFKVLEAETINQADGGDRHFQVSSDFIEDKPQASPEHGFDQFNQVSVAFPKVEIGSTLHFKYRREYNEVPFPGHFALRFDLGLNWYLKRDSIHIRSEMPLFVDKNDPQGKLEITQKKNGEDDYETTITLKSPVFTAAIDEPYVSINPKDETYVVVSSTRTYPDLAAILADRYDEVLSSPLPPLYRRILDDARARKTMVDRLNTITSELATEIRYLGDWRPVRGGHIPRPLETVASTKFGDCKDFAAATAAILRNMGVRANVVWVERAAQPQPLPAVAYDGAFNHAIVWASAEGREWWIDPTNFASFAQGLFPDIIDREALIVETKDKGGSRLGRIPAGKPAESVRVGLGRIRLEKSGDAVIDADLSFTGRAAEFYTGATLRQSREHVDHYLITSLVEESRLKWHKIGDYDLSSRITKDFGVHLSWGESMYSMRTTLGPAFYLTGPDVDAVLHLETKTRVSDIFLGQPDTVRSVDLYESVRALGHSAPVCSLDSPWMSVSRRVEQTPQGLRITDTRVVKKNLISIEELRSRRFQDFQAGLLKCFDRIAVVYERIRRAPRAISSMKAAETGSAGRTGRSGPK